MVDQRSARRGGSEPPPVPVPGSHRAPHHQAQHRGPIVVDRDGATPQGRRAPGAAPPTTRRRRACRARAAYGRFRLPPPGARHGAPVMGVLRPMVRVPPRQDRTRGPLCCGGIWFGGRSQRWPYRSPPPAPASSATLWRPAAVPAPRAARCPARPTRWRPSADAGAAAHADQPRVGGPTDGQVRSRARPGRGPGQVAGQARSRLVDSAERTSAGHR